MDDMSDFLAARERAAQRLQDMGRADPELVNLWPDMALIEKARDPQLSYQQIVSTLLKGYADRNALASRAYEVTTHPETGKAVRRVLPAYAKVSYNELAKQAEAVASFWRHDAVHHVDPDEMVAFIAFNGAEMTAVDVACIYSNAIIIPLQANYPTADLDQMLADTQPACLVASVENLEVAVRHALSQPSVRSLLVIAADTRVDAERHAIEQAKAALDATGGKVSLVTFAEAVEQGSQYEFEPLPAPEGGRDRMNLIMYTSGSTGTPKGAIIHEAIGIQAWTTPRSLGPMVSFIFAPMNHSYGRGTLYSALGQGGTAYFTQRSDLSTILEDVRLARPTMLMMIPRICELAQQHYLAEVGKRVEAGAAREVAEREGQEEMRNTFLGDRLTSASIGSAPTTPELRQLISDIFDIPIADGYGSTETGGGGITLNGRIMEHSVTDWKLIDVPELGYFTSDKPFPRGELLVKTRNMVKGYFNQPEATAAVFDEDGFLKTGDVMEQRGPNHIVWLDRRNNVIKLAQGEYVAIGPLETAFLGHARLVDQIYLHGNSQRAFLLAVVVPDIALARGALGHDPSDEDLRKLVLQDLRECASKAQIKTFEVPRDILIEREPFSLDNGLLSAVGKPLRAKLKAHYGERLEAIYDGMDKRLQEERDMLRDGGSDASTIERMAGAFKLSLGLTDIDPATAATYADLGGDSLGAVNFSMLLEDIFGVEVPVTSILHPSATPSFLAKTVDDLRAGATAGTRFASIHPDSECVRASDLTLEALLGAELVQQAGKAAAPISTPRTVLLTGANGFLGRFLCLEWMKRLADDSGKVICLVRGRNAAEARQRIVDAIGTGDASLATRFAELAENHLEVLPADLSAPSLGLGMETFERLTGEVDRIVHVAALVNHRMSYRSLFEPNVLGTTELLRLALSRRLKPFDYVSTVAVAHFGAEVGSAPESADIRTALPEIPIAGDRYALGYAASKWAGEIMLREANEHFGLPVSVMRADMILPHSRFAGQLNAPDAFIRLLASLLMTGIAPKSFYWLDSEGDRQPAHYDGMPVDFVAGAMQQIGEHSTSGFQTYNVVNANYDDGVSLDTITDWMIGAGLEITRIDDYAEWYRRFEEKLRNLPDRQRQASCLSIVGRFTAPGHIDTKGLPHADFTAVVERLPIGPDIPHLTEDYIRKCVEDIVRLGLVERPAELAI